jgi:hypothetical protein
MALRIHLIEKLGLIEPLPDAVDEYESGYWALTQARAESLVGGEIYFHRKQAEPSHLGGQILGFRVQEDGQYVGRIIFRFRADQTCCGVSAGAEGWAMEKKIVR